MIIDEKDYLEHYGTPRHSGRYPWGSGGEEEGNKRNPSFLDDVAKLKREGVSEANIAKGMGFKTTSELRARISIERNAQRQYQMHQVQKLRDKGMSNVAIGKQLGINESSVRSLLAPGQKEKADILQGTADMLRKQVDEKTYIDIGAGVEYHVGVSATRMKTAVSILEQEGYSVHTLQIETGPGKYTTMKVLAPPGTTRADVFKNRADVQQINAISPDNGRSYEIMQPPLSISSKRVKVQYGPDGGGEADGTMYIRPGVPDVSIGKGRYAQVRVAVDGTHYLKGIAIYKDDLPPGVDIVFNTPKKNTGNDLDALKPMDTKNPDNPFGATIKRQLLSPDGKGGVKVDSVMNIVNEEGDWDKWSRTLSSQTLSKQSPKLAKTQLDMTYSRRKNEFDEIMALTNPAVRKQLLESFADGADAAAVHLKAAALPRSSWHVIIPSNGLKENEIYAPNFKNGERVALIRYPHGGTFEIPELTVNNRHSASKDLLGRATDAVGINSKVAERLSGADFDGDAVLVIPNGNSQIKSSAPLRDLQGFDSKRYHNPDLPEMSDSTKQQKMGEVSNLITDMTIRGAAPDELARAVKHSMVVIDAQKHSLDYKRSAADNGIPALKAKYQTSSRGGASTLISRARRDVWVDEKTTRSAKDGGAIDKLTGEKVYVPTGRTKLDKHGKTVPKMVRSKELVETKNAHDLSSGTPIESVYADHSNRLKALANQARREYVNTKATPYSPSAKKAYALEVEDLNRRLKLALMNAPLERQAQLIANARVSQIRRANPGIDAKSIKKIKAQALAEARARTGAGKDRIYLSDKEWDAIQAGAISNHKLEQILKNSDLDRVKELATPRDAKTMTPSMSVRATTMLASGYTQAEVAEALGVSVSTIKSALTE